jgi:hypothetical protein
LDDLQIALKPALGAAFSDSSKIFCQEMTRFHDEDTNSLPIVRFVGHRPAGKRLAQNSALIPTAATGFARLKIFTPDPPRRFLLRKKLPLIQWLTLLHNENNVYLNNENLNACNT